MLCVPGLLQPEPLSLWQATADSCFCKETLNTQGSFGSISVGSLGPGAHKVVVFFIFIFIFLSPLSVSGVYGFDSKDDFAPPTILLGLFLCLWM